MSSQHPITPPAELVQEWLKATKPSDNPNSPLDLATRAAQWGSDQELEACCEWLDDPELGVDVGKLRAARRPKPPTLKRQALEAARIELNPEGRNGRLILQALEALPDD